MYYANQTHPKRIKKNRIRFTKQFPTWWCQQILESGLISFKRHPRNLSDKSDLSDNAAYTVYQPLFVEESLCSFDAPLNLATVMMIFFQNYSFWLMFVHTAIIFCYSSGRQMPEIIKKKYSKCSFRISSILHSLGIDLNW